jgi:uncharacterized OsmC-like protein
MAVTTAWRGGFECETAVHDSGHTFTGDEPEAFGGQNKGPNPFALLQASLANCTVVTVKGEADLLGVRLTDLEVEVRHKQNMVVRGPGDPEQRKLRITQLRRVVRVAGDLTDDQRERLLWAAEHCPVSNSLEGAVEVVTELEHVR